MTAEPFDSIAAVDQAIRERHTVKVLAAGPRLTPWPELEMRRGDAAVTEAIAAAGWAPFHYPASGNGAIEPWRVRLLHQPSATALAERLLEPSHFRQRVGKIPALLRGCGSVAIVTWLPAPEDSDSEKRTKVDQEHLLAVGGFVQSLLIALQARRLGSYWSSGGVLDAAEVRQTLGINATERLAAAVFIDYGVSSPQETIERVAGKLRGARSACEAWSSVVTVE